MTTRKPKKPTKRQTMIAIRFKEGEWISGLVADEAQRMKAPDFMLARGIVEQALRAVMQWEDARAKE